MSLTDYPELSASVDYYDLYGKTAEDEAAPLTAGPACTRCGIRTATDAFGGQRVCEPCYEHFLDMGRW